MKTRKKIDKMKIAKPGKKMKMELFKKVKILSWANSNSAMAANFQKFSGRNEKKRKQTIR